MVVDVVVVDVVVVDVVVVAAVPTTSSLRSSQLSLSPIQLEGFEWPRNPLLRSDLLVPLNRPASVEFSKQ